MDVEQGCAVRVLLEKGGCQVIQRLRHGGLVVRNLERAVEFYEALGFRIARRMEEHGPFFETLLGFHGAAAVTVKLSAPDGSIVELLDFGSSATLVPERSLRETGLTHLALTVSGLDQLYEALRNKGAVFNSAPQVSPDGAVKVCFCRDPEGNWLELVEPLH